MPRMQARIAEVMKALGVWKDLLGEKEHARLLELCGGERDPSSIALEVGVDARVRHAQERLAELGEVRPAVYHRACSLAAGGQDPIAAVRDARTEAEAPAQDGAHPGLEPQPAAPSDASASTKPSRS